MMNPKPNDDTMKTIDNDESSPSNWTMTNEIDNSMRHDHDERFSRIEEKKTYDPCGRGENVLPYDAVVSVSSHITTSIEKDVSKRFSFSSHVYIEDDDCNNIEEDNDETRPKQKGTVTVLSPDNKVYRRFRILRKDVIRFKELKILQVILAIIGGILTLSPMLGLRDPQTGLIIDQESPERTDMGLILVNGTERAIVATTPFQVACIGITRMSAFFMYPTIVVVFLSKFRASIYFLMQTPLAIYTYKDTHQLHLYCGYTILIFSIIHTVGHIARWAQQGNLNLLIQNASGLSGLFIIASCLLICIPMAIFRTRLRYEIRKRLHYLFIVFLVGLLFHTPTSAIPNGGYSPWVATILLTWYFVDSMYCLCFMSEKIDTTRFSVVDCGVRMTMTVSNRFQRMERGGFCYVCLPWIAQHEWHAFSIFERPSNPNERLIFIRKTGDWTTQVHEICSQRDAARPAWIYGPFPSPYNNADSYDNQILVASGIGITPALSVIHAHKNTRRINLVWAVRDEELFGFFIDRFSYLSSGWNIIFYTGKKKLRNQFIQLEGGTNVCIISGRPNFKGLIPNIIYGIESGNGLPENYTPKIKLKQPALKSHGSRVSLRDLAEEDLEQQGTDEEVMRNKPKNDTPEIKSTKKQPSLRHPSKNKDLSKDLAQGLRSSTSSFSLTDLVEDLEQETAEVRKELTWGSRHGPGLDLSQWDSGLGGGVVSSSEVKSVATSNEMTPDNSTSSLSLVFASGSAKDKEETCVEGVESSELELNRATATPAQNDDELKHIESLSQLSTEIPDEEIVFFSDNKDGCVEATGQSASRWENDHGENLEEELESKHHHLSTMTSFTSDIEIPIKFDRRASPDEDDPEPKNLQSNKTDDCFITSPTSDRDKVVVVPERGLGRRSSSSDGISFNKESDRLSFSFPKAIECTSSSMPDQQSTAAMQSSISQISYSGNSIGMLEKGNNNNQICRDYRPWEYQDGACEYVKNLDNMVILSSWGLLYCGGSKQVMQTLEEISDEYQIEMHSESFAW